LSFACPVDAINLPKSLRQRDRSDRCNSRRLYREPRDWLATRETEGQDAGLHKAQNGLLDWSGIRRVSESLTAGGTLLALAAAQKPS
jgi:hypothetical protein